MKQGAEGLSHDGRLCNFDETPVDPRVGEIEIGLAGSQKGTFEDVI
jgi:hypothetical protein